MAKEPNQRISLVSTNEIKILLVLCVVTGVLVSITFDDWYFGFLSVSPALFVGCLIGFLRFVRTDEVG